MYDYVTEDQYADLVNSRMEDEWVVGDVKGSGYDDTGKGKILNPLALIHHHTQHSLVGILYHNHHGGRGDK